MSQNEQILVALRRGPITALDAMSGMGVMRLAARVAELRERGYPVASQKVRTPGGKYVARYWL